MRGKYLTLFNCLELNVYNKQYLTILFHKNYSMYFFVIRRMGLKKSGEYFIGKYIIINLLFALLHDVISRINILCMKYFLTKQHNHSNSLIDNYTVV